MRIAIVSKFMYPRGGAEIAALSTRRLLLDNGHEVSTFGMNYPLNEDFPESKGYAPQVSFNRRSGLWDASLRVLGKGNVRKAAQRFLDEFKPQILHLHNVHSYLSPLIGELAAQRGIKVVWTLHDFKLICPGYTQRRKDSDNCTDCLRSPWFATAHTCLHNSLPWSLMSSLEALVWNRKRLESFTDTFIAPSEFMANRMIAGDFSPSKIKVIGNFVSSEFMKALDSMPRKADSDSFCYIGRLSEEKGVDTLLASAAQAGVKLKVAGTGPLEQALKEKYKDAPGITFCGNLDRNGVARLLLSSKAAVIPSECNENNPLAVMEALSAGTPVIGADIGGIPELISSENGMLFTSGNRDQLSRILKEFNLLKPFDNDLIASKARIKFAEATHYEKLLNIYSSTPAK